MALNKVELCGINTGTLPVLKSDEMRAMLEKIHEGDEEARQQFINANLRLVLSVIQRFQGRSDDLEDLFQIGCIGLIKSIDHFDLSQNVRFSTYAVPMRVLCRKAPGRAIGRRKGRFFGRFGAAKKNLKKLKKPIDKLRGECYNNKRCERHGENETPITTGYLGVAQFGSVLEWGSRGRKFESSHPDHEKANDRFDYSLYMGH